MLNVFKILFVLKSYPGDGDLFVGSLLTKFLIFARSLIRNAMGREESKLYFLRQNVQDFYLCQYKAEIC